MFDRGLNTPLFFKDNVKMSYVSLIFPSCRGQYTDLQSRSSDWFLYNGKIDSKSVNFSVNKYLFNIK